MDKSRERFGEIVYLVAFVLWMGVMFLRLTYFSRWVQIGEVTKAVQHIVLMLLLIKYAANPDFSLRSILKLAVLVLFMFTAYSYGKLTFAVSLALVCSARDISFEKLLKYTLVLQLICFCITVISSKAGIIEDCIWNAGWRDRHDFGFTHCLLGSHFVLFMSMACVVLCKKMKLWIAALIGAANYVMYVYTDARTTMILSVFLIVASLVAGFAETRCKPSRILAVLSLFVPFLFFGISVWGAKSFSYFSAPMMKLNFVLNGRLDLMQKALNEYGVTLFGQKIKWVGESTWKANPELIYNYVDNAFMQAFFNYGSIFVLLLCLGWGMVLYREMKKGRYVRAVVILVVLIHGLINPQMIELVYNPFFLLIGKEEKHYEQT